MNVASFGTFFDIGTELQALLPHRSGEPLPGLRTGDPTTVYIVEKRRDTGKLLCSLEPDRVHRFSRQDLVADGRTPYGGRVTSVDPRFGAFVDLGCEANGILPLRPAPGSGGGEVDEEVASLRPGDEVVAYIFQISRHTGKVSLTLRPRTTPLVAWEDVVADGQTRHDGVVIGKTDYGAFVDIGCAHAGFVPLRDFADIVAWDAVQVGSRFPMYVYVKSRDTGKITLSMHRSPRPRERWEAIVCDGQTPYEGHVISTSWYGVFVDIGCECHGRLPAPQAGLPADSRLDRLRAGDKVTAYVVEKRPDSGKVTLSLTRRASPLTHWKDLVADGQTPYEGFVTGTSAQGEWVDLNCDRLGLLPRRPSVVEQLGSPSREEELEIGSAVRVYVLRRNPTNGRLILALAPSATPRLPLEDALREPAARHDGLVYALDHARAFVDFGCEAGGVLPRSSASVGLAAGHRLLVHAAGFDADSGRVLLARARPPPPPRPSP